MTTAWRIPLCAHVCTTADAPNIEHANIYLAFADRHLEDAALLNNKARRLDPSAFRCALMSGAAELQIRADRYLDEIKTRNALLHYGSPKAKLAAASSFRQQFEGATC